MRQKRMYAALMTILMMMLTSSCVDLATLGGSATMDIGCIGVRFEKVMFEGKEKVCYSDGNVNLFVFNSGQKPIDGARVTIEGNGEDSVQVVRQTIEAGTISKLSVPYAIGEGDTIKGVSVIPIVNLNGADLLCPEDKISTTSIGIC